MRNPQVLHRLPCLEVWLLIAARSEGSFPAQPRKRDRRMLVTLHSSKPRRYKTSPPAIPTAPSAANSGGLAGIFCPMSDRTPFPTFGQTGNPFAWYWLRVVTPPPRFCACVRFIECFQQVYIVLVTAW